MVQGCPEPTINVALVDSAIAFCTTSLVIREKLTSFQTVNGQGVYDPDVPPQQEITRLLSATVNGYPAKVDAVEDTSYVLQTPGTPNTIYTTRVDSEFVLNAYPVPDGVYTVGVEVALRPTRTATVLQDDLLDLWVEPIVQGTLARLYSIPGQPFSDPATGEMMMLKSITGARKARIESTRNRTRGSLSIQMRPAA